MVTTRWCGGEVQEEARARRHTVKAGTTGTVMPQRDCREFRRVGATSACVQSLTLPHVSAQVAPASPERDGRVPGDDPDLKKGFSATSLRRISFARL